MKQFYSGILAVSQHCLQKNINRRFCKMIRRFILLALAAALLISGCNFEAFAAPSATIDERVIITAAAATAFAKLTQVARQPTETQPVMTDTSAPPTLAPSPTVEVTLVPVDALCLSNAQVRSWPGNGGESYGGVLLNRGVKVLARNLNGTWFLIDFADSPTGTGWVFSRAFKLKSDVSQLPIALDIGNGQFSFVAAPYWKVTNPILPLPTLSNDPSIRPATLIAQANVRICPNQSCMSIGILKIGDQITMTGRYGQNDWAQFIYPSGPGGRGWVLRDLIQLSSNSFGGLPYFDLLGNLITPAPPTSTPDPNISPTPTLTATSTPPGPIAVITDVTTVYSLQSSLSTVLGTLNPKDRIYITHQSINHLWFEIQYPPDSTGRGYISAKFVSLTGDYRNLPYSDAQGTPIP
jgi:hypothetical protein